MPHLNDVLLVVAVDPLPEQVEQVEVVVSLEDLAAEQQVECAVVLAELEAAVSSTPEAKRARSVFRSIGSIRYLVAKKRLIYKASSKSCVAMTHVLS